MLIGIDHVVIACPDVAAAARELEAAVGLRAAGGGRHEALGTENRLVWLGDSYLELIGVFDPALAERSWLGRPTLRALDRGGGFATFAITVDRLQSELERLRSLGAVLEGPRAGERRRPDGDLVRWMLATPASLGPDEPPFLIEHDATAAEWTPDDRSVRSSERHPLGSGVRLEALEVPVLEVAKVQARYLRTLAILFRPSLTGHGARDASIGRQVIRLRRGRPGDPAILRLRAIDAGADRREVGVLGCRFVIEPAS